MLILVCKLALAPAFVVLVSVAVRRLGPRIGGLFGGLPVVAGPILFVYALDHGEAFAGHAAASSLAALVALTAFVGTVAAVAGVRGRSGVRAGRSLVDPSDRTVGAAPATLDRAGAPDVREARRTAWIAVVAGWAVFSALAAVIATLAVPPAIGLAVCALTFVVALRVVPLPDPAAVAGTPRRPRHDLLLRAGAAAAMVLVLTSLAGSLGPAASGVLAPFPTITSVLVGFAVAHETRATTLHLMRGMIRGFFSFAAFLFVVAVAVEPLGVAAAFLAGIAATAAVQGVLLAWPARPAATEPAPTAAESPTAA